MLKSSDMVLIAWLEENKGHGKNLSAANSECLPFTRPSAKTSPTRIMVISGIRNIAVVEALVCVQSDTIHPADND
jgi:hypothetical protein